MRLRRATTEDVDAIAHIESLAALHPWSPAQIASSLVQPTTCAWVVGTPVCAHLLATAVAEEGEVLTIAVHPGARRQGHARTLLAALDAAWRAQGIRSGFLEVSEPNSGARALYAALGWREVGRRVGYYADGSDALVLRKEVLP